MTLQERALKINRVLAKTYPDARCELDHRNPLELLVATILSAQCTDKRVNLVTPELFKRYRSAKDYADSSPEELTGYIRSTGFYLAKGKNIMGACRRITETFGGRVPDRMEDLVTLPGVGRKTANVILGTAFQKTEGVVVDTHVLRLSKRLGLSRQKDPEKVEEDLMRLIPRKEWILFSHRIVFHGRRLCEARAPRCPECPVRNLCPKIGV